MVKHRFYFHFVDADAPLDQVLLLSTYYLLLTTQHTPPNATRHLLRTTLFDLLTTYYSLLTTHYPLRATLFDRGGPVAVVLRVAVVLA